MRACWIWLAVAMGCGGGGASFETAKEMLASSGMAERVIAASDDGEPAASGSEG